MLLAKQNTELTVSEQEQLRLKDLSLDELAVLGEGINTQSKLKMGIILLEARSRFQADYDFGLWRSDKLPDLLRETSTRLMNLARFFAHRPMGNIGLSVGYIISAPCNEGDADELYSWAMDLKRVRLDSTKEKLQQIHLKNNPLPLADPKPKVIEEVYVPSVLDGLVTSFHGAFNTDTKWQLSCDRIIIQIEAIDSNMAQILHSKCADRYYKENPKVAPMPDPIIEAKITDSDARRIFGIGYPLEKWAVDAIYRVLSKTHHPDLGGDHDAMIRVNLAKTKLLGE